MLTIIRLKILKGFPPATNPVGWFTAASNSHVNDYNWIKVNDVTPHALHMPPIYWCVKVQLQISVYVHHFWWLIHGAHAAPIGIVIWVLFWKRVMLSFWKSSFQLVNKGFLRRAGTCEGADRESVWGVPKPAITRAEFVSFPNLTVAPKCNFC